MTETRAAKTKKGAAMSRPLYRDDGSCQPDRAAVRTDSARTAA
jgi:hypothetical protein